MSEIDFSPQPWGNAFDSMSKGVQMGANLGFEAKRNRLLAEEEARRQKQIDDALKLQKVDKAFEYLSHKGVPKGTKEAIYRAVAPTASEVFGVPFPTEPGQWEDTDAEHFKRYRDLLKMKSDGKMTDDVFRHSVASLTSEITDAETRKQLMENAKFALGEKPTNESFTFQGYDRNNNPVFSSNKSTTLLSGSSTAAPGQLLAKTPTADQTNAQTFATRASDANRQLDDLVKRGFNPAGLNVAIQQSLPSMMQSENVQALEQIGRNLAGAILRKESGAAISNTEWSEAKKQYIPQPGDKPEVLEQKRINRERAIQGLSFPAGQLPSLPNQSGGLMPGAIEDGHKFKGGNPADPNNWEKL